MIVDSPYAELIAALPVTDGRVEVLGSQTRYWSYGPPDATTTIIAVHGFRGDHHGLEPVVAQLRGIRIISPDLPAFGESTPFQGRKHSIDSYALWLREFVTALGLSQPPVILGHSFGSIVVAASVDAGLDAPQLILINPIAAPALAGPKAILTWLTVAYYGAAQALPERAGRALLASPVIVRFMSSVMATTKDRRLRRWVHDQHDRYFSSFSSATTLAEGFQASISANVKAFRKSLTMPTLLIGAEHDPITTVHALRSLAEGMPGEHRLHILPDVGHLIHYERPAEAAAAIVDFLGDGSVAGPPG